MDILTYAISKKVAASAVSGVQSVAVQDTTLLITTNDGNVLPMVFPTPADGVSVVDVDIDENNMLMFSMSDGSTIPAGQINTIKGADGKDGYTPQKGIDYWTNDDVQEIKNYVDNQIGGALNGTY